MPTLIHVGVNLMDLVAQGGAGPGQRPRHQDRGRILDGDPASEEHLSTYKCLIVTLLQTYVFNMEFSLIDLVTNILIHSECHAMDKYNTYHF